MDPLDHLRALPDGVRCTVCDEHVPAERIRLLAWRDDLAFLQIDCGHCLSTTLGFSMASDVEAAAADGLEGTPAADAISADDVLDMHQLLAGWHGDLAGLLSLDRRARGDRDDDRHGAGPGR